MGRRTAVIGAVVLGLVTVTAAPAGAVTLRQSVDDTITPGVSITCNVWTYHEDNLFLRRFDLDDDRAVSGAFAVASVSFGVEYAESGADPSQPLSVRLAAIPAADPTMTMADLTPLQDVSTSVTDDESGTVKTVAARASVVDPATTDLVVAVAPEAKAARHAFSLGANSSDETRPSYLSAPACGVPEPQPMAVLGFPATRWVLFLDGEEVSGPDADGDGLPDGHDNCATTANPDQANHDRDPDGDGCDPDDDGDEVVDDADACAVLAGVVTPMRAQGCPVAPRRLTGSYSERVISGDLTSPTGECTGPGEVVVGWRRPDGTSRVRTVPTDGDGAYAVSAGRVQDGDRFWVRAPAAVVPDVAFCPRSTLTDPGGTQRSPRPAAHLRRLGGAGR